MKSENLLKLLPLGIGLSLLCGCASRQIETQLITPSPAPTDFVGARLFPDNISVSVRNVPPEVQTGFAYNFGEQIQGSMNGTFYTPSVVVTERNRQATTSDYDFRSERGLYFMLRQFSHGKISEDSHSDYDIVQIMMNGSFPDKKAGQVILLGSASFLIFPLAEVKTTLDCSYQGGYILRRGDQYIRTNTFNVYVKGDFNGWYVAGAIQGNKLATELNNRAQFEIASKIANDIYATIEEDQKMRGAVTNH